MRETWHTAALVVLPISATTVSAALPPGLTPQAANWWPETGEPATAQGPRLLAARRAQRADKDNGVVAPRRSLAHKAPLM